MKRKLLFVSLTIILLLTIVFGLWFKIIQNDDAGLTFLDRKIEKFATDFTSKRLNNSVSDEEYHRVSRILGKYMHLEPSLEHSQKILTQIKEEIQDPYFLLNRLLEKSVKNTIHVRNANLKTFETLNVSSASWEPKTISYLIKRRLGVFLDTSWYYAPLQSLTWNPTVAQRRLNESLQNIEAMDFVFGPEVSDLQVVKTDDWRSYKKQIQINLRLAESNHEFIRSSKSLYSKVIVNLPKEKTLRLYIGTYKDFTLKEIIVFFPEQLKNIVKTRPLKRIDFMGLLPALPGKSASLKTVAPDLTEILFWMSALKLPWMDFFKPSWKPIEKPIEFYDKISPEIENFYKKHEAGMTSERR